MNYTSTTPRNSRFRGFVRKLKSIAQVGASLAWLFAGVAASVLISRILWKLW